MQSRASSLGFALVLLIVAPSLAAAQTASAVAGITNFVSRTEQLDELQVVGKKLYRIRMGAVDVEDRFFALYNDLNQNDDFDIHCRVEAPTGTLLKVRICRLALYEKALEEEARAYLSGVDSPPPAQMVALARIDDYRQNALAIINSSTQLRQLIRERETLEEKYWAARKRSARMSPPIRYEW